MKEKQGGCNCEGNYISKLLPPPPAKNHTNLHDDHYRKIESTGMVEPIVVMENLHDRLLNSGIPANSALNIVLAQKHITRAGMKAGDDWKKDIEKSINYLTRALTGEWKSVTIGKRTSRNLSII